MSSLEVDYWSPLYMEAGSSLLTKVQKQLLQDLMHVPTSTQQSYEHWFWKLSCQGLVLIVLDGIYDKSQFDKLIPDTSLLSPRGWIIVTSRDRHLLKLVARRTNFYLYEVKILGSDDSEKLFNWYAFGNEEAQENFKYLVQDVIKACEGLSLALKVVGCSLFDKLPIVDLRLWREAKDALHGNHDIMNAFRWSYNYLSEPEKLMFLDVVCIFYGWEKEDALKI